MENALKYFKKRCKDLKMCLDTCRDKDGLEKAIAHNEKVVEALEKQMPKQPSNYKGYEGKCICGAVFLDRNTKYCGNCGQALDWGENSKD